MLSKKGRTKWEFKTNKRKVHRFWFPGNLRLSESDIASGKNVFSFCMFRRTLTARLEPSAPPTPPPPETPQRWTQLPDQQRWLFKLTQSTYLVFNWSLAFVNNISPPEHLQVRTSVTDDQPSTLHSRHQTTKLPQIPNTIAWRSPGSHLKVTWRSPDGHLMVTWWSPEGHLIWWSPAAGHRLRWATLCCEIPVGGSMRHPNPAKTWSVAVAVNRKMRPRP